MVKIGLFADTHQRNSVKMEDGNWKLENGKWMINLHDNVEVGNGQITITPLVLNTYRPILLDIPLRIFPFPFPFPIPSN